MHALRPLVLVLMPGLLAAQTVLPGTRPLSFEGDAGAQMMEAIHAYLDRETAAAAKRRQPGTRDQLRTIIGAVDERVPATELRLEATTAHSAEVAKADGYRVLAVRWPVFEDVEAAGLLLQPDGPPRARVVAIPDADWTPEMLAGLAPGQAPLARRLAENGCQVLVPVLIDRGTKWSGIPGIRMTNQTHREWIYRMAFEAGRHIIGYEVQKVLAAVDWFEHENASRRVPVGVAGYGEGGLLALYAAGLDPRIGAALVSGYPRDPNELWKEPIYHDVWGLLRGFGDAELASLIAPRKLVIGGEPGWDQSIAALLGSLGIEGPLKTGTPPVDLRKDFDPEVRLHQQFDQLVAHTQAVIRRSPKKRAEFWSRADASTPQRWKETTAPLRTYIWEEVIGRLPDPRGPMNPRTRLIFDEPKFRGYEVMLDVWPDVFAYGILLVPKNIRQGERRPVVVCQHGLEGRPRDVADPAVDSHYYHRFAVRLAEQGYVTFAPQNPYIGEDRFRQIQRKAHPLKLSLFSFILGQHQRILEWLGDLPFVDRSRIGFYGLSYGGKTAVRVPPLLDGYALSICSADFNEWVWKTTSVDAPYTYMLTKEYDMLEFNFANVVNYAELASLMAPRPFMVERGHDDGVAPDEWVAYEYARVRRFYAKMGLSERTEIEFFNGPHTINGVGTFRFLAQHLGRPPE